MGWFICRNMDQSKEKMTSNSNDEGPEPLVPVSKKKFKNETFKEDSEPKTSNLSYDSKTNNNSWPFRGLFTAAALQKQTSSIPKNISETPSISKIDLELKNMDNSLVNNDNDLEWSNLSLNNPFNVSARMMQKNSNYPNPILALIANRSSQLFGFLRPLNPPPGVLDLPTILMLQNNILTMLNSSNRQVSFKF